MRYLAKILICLGLLSTTISGIQAEEKQESNQNAEKSIIVEYSFEGNKIREVAEANINGESINVNRLINEDGTFKMIITNGNEIEQVEGIIDYKLFEKIANSYIINSYKPVPYNSDVTGSQFMHIFISGGTEAKISAAIIGTSVSISTVASVLFLEIAAPASVIIDIAGIVVGILTGSSKITEVIISSDTWEVQFSYDGGYYTHCYHQMIKTYDSSGHFLDSYLDYFQVIGG